MAVLSMLVIANVIKEHEEFTLNDSASFFAASAFPLNPGHYTQFFINTQFTRC